jgi:hypothetical protein
MSFVWFSEYTAIISLSSINQLMLVMAMCYVSFQEGYELGYLFDSEG